MVLDELLLKKLRKETEQNTGLDRIRARASKYLLRATTNWASKPLTGSEEKAGQRKEKNNKFKSLSNK